MKRSIRLLNRSVLALAMVGALAFGAAEALAAPRPKPRRTVRGALR